MRYGAITLDTSIFHRNGLRLNHGLLGALGQFRGKPAGLLISEIVARELVSHLTKKATETISLVERAVRDAEEYLNVCRFNVDDLDTLLGDGKSAEDIAKERFSDFIDRTGATLVSVDGLLDVKGLIKRYFDGLSPFSVAGKKKSEFPDAMILMTLEEYAKNNNIKILAVSADSDWEEYANGSEWIFIEPNLGKAIAEFQPQNNSFALCEILSGEFAKTDSDLFKALAFNLQDAVGKLDFDTDAASVFHWETVQVDVELDGFDFSGAAGRAELYPIHHDNHEITVETKINIRAIATGEFSLSVYDSVDRDMVYMGVARKSINFDFDASVLMVITGDLDCEIFGASLDKIEMSYRQPMINFGSLEPGWHDE